MFAKKRPGFWPSEWPSECLLGGTHPWRAGRFVLHVPLVCSCGGRTPRGGGIAGVVYWGEGFSQLTPFDQASLSLRCSGSHVAILGSVLLCGRWCRRWVAFTICFLTSSARTSEVGENLVNGDHVAWGKGVPSLSPPSCLETRKPPWS